jgi:hypothetical protein
MARERTVTALIESAVESGVSIDDAVRLFIPNANLLADAANSAVVNGQFEIARICYQRLAEMQPEDNRWRQQIDRLQPDVIAVWSFDDGLANTGSYQCELAVRHGVLSVRQTGSDPQIWLPVFAPAGDFEIVLRYRAGRNYPMVAFWGESIFRLSDDRCVVFHVSANSDVCQDLAIPFSSQSPFTLLRVDPSPNPEDSLEIDSILLRRRQISE